MVPAVPVAMMTMSVMMPVSARTDGFLAVLQLVHQHGNEDHAADDADDQLNGNLIGNDDRSCKDIADQNEQCTKQSCIKQRAPDLITLEQGYEVGNDQADIGDLTHDHDDGCGEAACARCGRKTAGWQARHKRRPRARRRRGRGYVKSRA